MSSHALTGVNGYAGLKRMLTRPMELTRPEEPDPEAGQWKSSASSSLPFEPLTLIFRDLRYFVPAPKGAVPKKASAAQPQQKGDKGGPPQLELLKSLTGFAAPGVLTALMGGSGEF